MTEIEKYRTVEKAIIYLDNHSSRDVSLSETADHVGLSEYHFHRLFTRWAGTTPDRFFRYLKKEYLRSLLLSSAESLLDTTYEGGLSNPSRLHDLFVTYEALTPGQLRSRGAGIEVRYGVHPSPYGMCFIAVTGRGILELRFLDENAEETLGAEGPADALAAETGRDLGNAVFLRDQEETAGFVESIFSIRSSPAERRRNMEKPLHLLLRGTNFQIKVWEALLRIPEGRVISYGRIAQALGMPTAARAVGSAVGGNRIAYLIPCHRVIKGIGASGDYRWGIYRKRAILCREISGGVTDAEGEDRDCGP
mgnify:CR=1 FL=1